MTWLPREVRARDARDELRRELRELDDAALERRLTNATNALAGLDEMVRKGLGAFIERDREDAQLEQELIQEIMEERAFAAKAARRPTRP